jgi:hypothetical protein
MKQLAVSCASEGSIILMKPEDSPNAALLELRVRRWPAGARRHEQQPLRRPSPPDIDQPPHQQLNTSYSIRIIHLPSTRHLSSLSKYVDSRGSR